MLSDLSISSWCQATGRFSTGWGPQRLFLNVENILRQAAYFQSGAITFLKWTAATQVSALYQSHLLKFAPPHLLLFYLYQIKKEI